ncbi:nucleoside-diphosphate sugar epimerase [Hoeflea sp. BAL378]|uniref:SDR family oxidoreductase n=1 Tax=Hoeflea sp. BAL378 TaxID=1547437 RepID=UPI0005133EFA|nr:SDR family oxidoreductase [Hoeflea sp. BAL378]KGF68793.1 nucleoside-diphosphate sugar epimerase [Hoeflea sp. BAL378]
MTGKILVTGASGHLGARILHHLLESHGVAAAGLVAGSRDPAKLGELAGKGVETRRIDFDDPASLTDGFSGIDLLLIVSTDALDAQGTRLRQQLAAVEAARQAGVGRIFYTSMPGADDSLITFAPDHLGTEQAIKASGLAYTIFRNGWYMENLFMALPAALAHGQWYSSAGQGRLAHIARDDIARAIAGGLASPPAENITYTLTGDTARTTDEIAALVRAATGKPLEVVHVDDAHLAKGMEAAGVPAPYIPTFVSFDANTREGKIAMVTDDARTLSGATLTSLADFLKANTAALAG